MDYLFKTYGKYLLIAVVVLLYFVGVEAQLPARIRGQRMIVAYPLFAKLLCIVLVLFVAFFALALAGVPRASVYARLGIFSMLGVPVIVLLLETFGKKVEVDGDFVSRSYFGVISNTRRCSSVTCVKSDTVWKMFRVYFEDGSTLWISTAMRGSAQLAEKLTKIEPNKVPLQTLTSATPAAGAPGVPPSVA
jgi:hypothetical protein